MAPRQDTPGLDEHLSRDVRDARANLPWCGPINLASNRRTESPCGHHRPTRVGDASAPRGDWRRLPFRDHDARRVPQVGRQGGCLGGREARASQGAVGFEEVRVAISMLTRVPERARPTEPVTAAPWRKTTCTYGTSRQARALALGEHTNGNEVDGSDNNASDVLLLISKHVPRGAVVDPLVAPGPTAAQVAAAGLAGAGSAATGQGPGLTRTQLVAFLKAAESKIGRPYVWGGAGPNVFDCSGLVQWSLAQAGVVDAAGRRGPGADRPGRAAEPAAAR